MKILHALNSLKARHSCAREVTDQVGIKNMETSKAISFSMLIVLRSVLKPIFFLLD